MARANCYLVANIIILSRVFTRVMFTFYERRLKIAVVLILSLFFFFCFSRSNYTMTYSARIAKASDFRNESSFHEYRSLKLVSFRSRMIDTLLFVNLPFHSVARTTFSCSRNKWLASMKIPCPNNSKFNPLRWQLIRGP